MTKPLVTFPDPEAAVIGVLKADLVGRPETYAAATVSTGFPKSLTAGPHVQVELEVGSPDAYPVTERAQVRVTCWATGRSNVKSLASLARGLLCSYGGDADVSGIFPVAPGRSGVITDPDTGYLMCWFLVRVDVKALVAP